MPQIFSRSANTVAPLSIALAILLVGGGILSIMGLDRSEYITEIGVAKVQPVQFSTDTTPVSSAFTARTATVRLK